MLNTSWLYENEAHSDGALELQEQTEGKAKVLARLPIHSALLSSASEYFKTRLSSDLWKHPGVALGEAALVLSDLDSSDSASHIPADHVADDKTSNQNMNSNTSNEGPDAKKRKLDDELIVAKPVVIEIVTASELPAALAVLKGIYTGKVDQGASAPGLFMTAVMADRWGIPNLVDASLQALMAIPLDSISLDCMNDILELRYRCTGITTNPNFTALKEHFGKQMVVAFKDIRATLQTHRRELFKTMPYELVLLWAGQDGLAGNEEDVIGALSFWWYSNIGDIRAAQAQSQRVKAAILKQQEMEQKHKASGNRSIARQSMWDLVRQEQQSTAAPQQDSQASGQLPRPALSTSRSLSQVVKEIQKGGQEVDQEVAPEVTQGDAGRSMQVTFEIIAQRGQELTSCLRLPGLSSLAINQRLRHFTPWFCVEFGMQHEFDAAASVATEPSALPVQVGLALSRCLPPSCSWLSRVDRTGQPAYVSAHFKREEVAHMFSTAQANPGMTVVVRRALPYTNGLHWTINLTYKHGDTQPSLLLVCFMYGMPPDMVNASSVPYICKAPFRRVRLGTHAHHGPNLVIPEYMAMQPVADTPILAVDSGAAVRRTTMQHCGHYCLPNILVGIFGPSETGYRDLNSLAAYMVPEGLKLKMWADDVTAHQAH